jgi:hypothetical protein
MFAHEHILGATLPQVADVLRERRMGKKKLKVRVWTDR